MVPRPWTHVVPPGDVRDRWVGVDGTLEVHVVSLFDVGGVQRGAEPGSGGGQVWGREPGQEVNTDAGKHRQKQKTVRGERE